jgi:ABC-type nitrate/sulfonate/bicarbonate transport system ATPase subunit
MTPVQFLASKFPGKSEQDYRQHLGNFQISGMTGLQLIGTLSGGQKSRVAFSALSLQQPHVLLLDEVCSVVALAPKGFTDDLVSLAYESLRYRGEKCSRMFDGLYH